MYLWDDMESGIKTCVIQTFDSLSLPFCLPAGLACTGLDHRAVVFSPKANRNIKDSVSALHSLHVLAQTVHFAFRENILPIETPGSFIFCLGRDSRRVSQASGRHNLTQLHGMHGCICNSHGLHTVRKTSRVNLVSFTNHLAFKVKQGTCLE